MARKFRVQYPGAIYHVLNRGDRRERIFADDFDRRRFLETLAETCAKTGWQIHAYCLMGNHFHLVVETPRANLVAGMKWFLCKKKWFLCKKKGSVLTFCTRQLTRRASSAKSHPCPGNCASSTREPSTTS